MNAIFRASAKKARSSKANDWYFANLDGHVTADARTLLEQYSHIPPEDVDSHIYKLRDILWAHGPYPCVGEFKFLAMNLRRHPSYSHVLHILTASGPPQVELLDLGCCVAQELRALAHDGVPSVQLYGSDLNPGYLKTSYELFNDKDSFQGTLIPGNIFSDDNFKGGWRGWEKKFGVIHAGLFLHLFDWNQQIQVGRQIVKLLAESKGTLFLGEMVGCQRGGHSSKSTFWKQEVERKQFLHDEESFRKLWEEVSKKTGTVGEWKVEASLKVIEKNGNESRSYFVGEGIGWFVFSVERI